MKVYLEATNISIILDYVSVPRSVAQLPSIISYNGYHT